jgi:uncharacterized protein YcgI (DUF1989 family)
MSRVQIQIPPKSAQALRLGRGDVLRVIDIEGLQVADVVAFDATDPREHLSQGFTRANNDMATVKVGDKLFSNLNSPLLTVVEDTVGVHDLLFPPCSRFLYERVFGVQGKTGCREHLAAALEQYGIGFELVTDPFNAFMNAGIDDAGRMVISEPHSRPGDHVDLRAERDLIVGVSACAADVNDCNGGVCTSIGLEVLPAMAP